MKVSTEVFPFYEQCKAKFGVDINKNVVFTYGDAIHARCKISPDLLVHESTHSKQQALMGKDLWWKVYLDNEEFRIKQEVEAYRNQYNFLKNNNRERNHAIAHRLASDLSGTTYGKCITYKEAYNLITK